MDHHHKRLVLEDSLYRRVGELGSHFGRYDMHALLIETLLVSASMRDAKRPRHTLQNRGEYIVELLRLREIPQRLHTEFTGIDAAMQLIYQRHLVSARCPAVIGKTTGTASSCTERDWYDFANSDDQELARHIDDIEADILQIVGLYIRLAAVAHDVRDALTYLH